MDSYLKELLTTGVLTPEQFAAGLKNLSRHYADAKNRRVRKRKRQIDANETKIRTALRSMMKWMFDGELDRSDSPLFVVTVDGEKMLESVFLPIANQTVSNLSQDPLIAAISNRSKLIDSIRTMVKHRRSNLKNSKKPNRKRLRIIYQLMDKFLVYDAQGNAIEIPRPQLLAPSSSNRDVDMKFDPSKSTPTVENPARKRLKFPSPPISVTSRSTARSTTPIDNDTSTSSTPASDVIREASSRTSSPENIVLVSDSDEYSTQENELRSLKEMHKQMCKQVQDMKNEIVSLRAMGPTVESSTPAQTAEPSWMREAKNRTCVEDTQSFVCCVCHSEITASEARPSGMLCCITYTSHQLSHIHTHSHLFMHTHTHPRWQRSVLSKALGGEESLPQIYLFTKGCKQDQQTHNRR